MRTNTPDHPNMLGLAILAGLLGGTVAVLSLAAFVTKRELPDFTAATAAIVLLGVAVASFRAHRRLARLTPEERDAYWRAFDEKHRANHERNVEAYVRRGKDGIG